MGYGRTVLVDGSVAEALPKVKEAFAAQGFGTLAEIDVQATIKEKLGLNVEPYVIVGACNPRLAHRALEIERTSACCCPATWSCDRTRAGRWFRRWIPSSSPT